MLKVLIAFFAASAVVITSFFAGNKIKQSVTQTNIEASESAVMTSIMTTANALVTAGGDKYADGSLPLGDKKYVTDAPKKGYIYLCQARSDEAGGGAGKDGPWIHGITWNIKEKLSISGKVKWDEAKFSNSISGDSRALTGNGLPINHTSGVFPVQSSDAAYEYDKNPNKISAQSLSLNLPTSPTLSDLPNCMGGEVGIMLTGVPLFNGFDAQLRDAAAHEVQDGCQGHPQVSGEYHYHSLSGCINDVSTTTVIGYALDGFPITGPQVSTNKYLTTDDLDECHGTTSEITMDGKKVSTYHYVMTVDFPYSVSCFKGKPVSMQVMKSAQMQGMQNGKPSQGQNNQNQQLSDGSANSQRPQPPQEAITACSGKSQNNSCSFTSPMGQISGTCQTPPGQTSIICVPSQRPQ